MLFYANFIFTFHEYNTSPALDVNYCMVFQNNFSAQCPAMYTTPGYCEPLILGNYIILTLFAVQAKRAGK